METTPNAKSIRQLIAKNVRSARKRLGISQMKLAEKLDLSAGYMNDVERARRWVGAETLARLASVLHLKPYQFFVENGDSATDIHTMLSEIVSELRESADSNIERIVMRHATVSSALSAKRMSKKGKPATL
jgi:transcriptional regulator with XRE-family HTH domain